MMISYLKKRVLQGITVLVVSVGVFAIIATIALIALRVTPIEGVTYPKATSDFSIIETWSEREVYSFSDDLGCFNIPYNNEFEKRFPEEVEFCRKVRNVWAEKYDKNKESNMNWELYRSLEEG